MSTQSRMRGFPAKDRQAYQAYNVVTVMCDPIVFSSVSATQWDALKSRIQSAGIALTLDHGTVHVGPAELAWDHDPTTETLTVTCTHKLFVLPCATVTKKIRDLFAQAIL